MTREDAAEVDPSVAHSQDLWRRTRRHLNIARPGLSRLAASLHDPAERIGDTCLLAKAEWLPARPVDLAAITLDYQPNTPAPDIDGTEPEVGNALPYATLMRRYQRYTHAVRDLDHPRLFDNRPSWRMLDLSWNADKGAMSLGPSSYFAGVDVCEAAAHEMAHAYLDEEGAVRAQHATMHDLPFRRRIGDLLSFTRRPALVAISTLLIRRDQRDASFILHHRDSRDVTIAAGMLQVIPSGIFQPCSILPAIADADFDLWRNIMREYSEELLGNPEHYGDGQPVRYDIEPFAGLDQARADGRIRAYCLGFGFDALTLVGEILTVAVIDAPTFDQMAADFVDVNDEGTVLNSRIPFTEAEVAAILRGGRISPAGSGCLHLALRHRDTILDF